MVSIRKLYQRLVSIGITEELSFSEKLRIELNNLFLGIALPCVIAHLIYLTLGPHRLSSYIITSTWVFILLVPLYLNYRKKYFISKLYTILVTLFGVSIVHMLHGWGIRLEPTYLMLILLCSFFFQERLAIWMSIIVGVDFIIVAIVLFNITSPLAGKIIPSVPFAYLMFTVVSSIVMIRKILRETEKFNRLNTKQNDDLAQKNKQLEKFTYIASHDLKTPIRNVTSFAGLIDRDLEKKRYQVIPERLAYIKSSALQMAALVEDILQISTTDHAAGEIRVLNNLNQVIADVQLTLKNELLTANAVIESEELPDYVCNASEFYLVFQNLIQNGVKYNESKQPLLQITSTQIGKELQLHFKDNGIGIEEAYHEQIFEFFKRLHPSSEYEGTGLGLGLCNRIIEGYKGKITLVSTLGQGSTFTVHLPISTLPSSS